MGKTVKAKALLTQRHMSIDDFLAHYYGGDSKKCNQCGYVLVTDGDKGDIVVIMTIEFGGRFYVYIRTRKTLQDNGGTSWQHRTEETSIYEIPCKSREQFDKHVADMMKSYSDKPFKKVESRVLI